MFNNFKIKTIHLTVQRLSEMAAFYQEVIGLELLQQSTSDIHLGLPNTSETLLVLKENQTASKLAEAGLYHIAFLLPSRIDLANYTTHLINTGYPLDGAADHGYSEALYLTDPEGNGIEIYQDKPQSDWNITDSGEIIGVTDPLDVNDLLAIRTTISNKMPKNSFIGHIHLNSTHLKNSETFFTTILQMNLTYRFGSQALFFGVDGYHHQIASNTWQRYQKARTKDTLGLSLMEIYVSNSYYELIKNNLLEHNWPYKESDSNLLFTDSDQLSYLVTRD